MTHEPPVLSEYSPAFQWFGGKARVADTVWAALGDVDSYVEPFFGSGAMLLLRPDPRGERTEVVNDYDGFVANFWRAVKSDREAVASYCDWPCMANTRERIVIALWLRGMKQSEISQIMGYRSSGIAEGQVSDSDTDRTVR